MSLKDYLNIEIRTSKEESYLHILYKALFEPSFEAVWLIRMALYSRIPLLRYFFRRKLKLKYGVYIGDNTIIEAGLRMQHPTSIVIGNHVKIGKRCTIFQNVTIGIDRIHSGGGYPTIGDDVIIYAGAKVIGPISIGNNSIIGANAVVTKSTPPNSIIVGVPATWKTRK